MFTLKSMVRVKVGAIKKDVEVEVTLYNSQDVAGMLGIQVPAVTVAAKKAGVGHVEGHTYLFTAADVEVLKGRPKQGRPVKVTMDVAPADTAEVKEEVPVNANEVEAHDAEPIREEEDSNAGDMEFNPSEAELAA